MSAEQSYQNLKAHLEAEYASVKDRIEQDLPEVGKLVSDAAGNPVTIALAASVHLPEAPEVMQAVADLIVKWDAALGAAKAQGAAEAQQAAAAVPAPDVPVQSPAA